MALTVGWVVCMGYVITDLSGTCWIFCWGPWVGRNFTPGGSQQAFLTGLAHLYNLVPYQRRAQQAGQCGVEVEGGRVPTADWFLNLQTLTSGGFRSAVTASTTKSDGM